MSWLPWVIGGVVLVIAGWFVISRLGGSAILKRRKETIAENIKELDKEKEAADADIEARRADYHDRNPFD